MKRPILIATIGLILGIIWGLYSNIVSFMFLLTLLYIILYFAKKNWKRLIKLFINKKVLIVFSIFFLIGYVYINYKEIDYNKIYNSLDKVKCVGTVISQKQEKNYTNVYKIRIEEINDKKINRNFFISIKKKNKINIKYSDKIEFEGEYKKPDIQRNYQGFDYSYYLKSDGIYGTISINSNIRVIKHNNLNLLYRSSYKLRNMIINAVNKIFPDEAKGVFLGILIGYDEYITDDIKENFSNSSLSHLLAVSGTHISYIILGVVFFLKILKVPKKECKIITCVFLLFYLYIINFTSSVTRAVIMSVISILQMVLYRKQDTLTTISFSVFLVLISNPYKILNIGFLLSYAGTIGIILFISEFNHSPKNNIKKLFKKMYTVTLSAWILVFPIILYNFNSFSTLFLISNLIAGIIIGPIIIIGLLIIFLSLINLKLSFAIVKFYNVLLIILIKATEFISNIPISNIYVKTPNIILIIVYYFLILIISLIIKIKKSNRQFLKTKLNDLIFNVKNKIIKNKINITFLIIMLFILISFFYCIPKDLKINFIDVGQGDSTLVTTPLNKKILIDGGGNENYDVGKNILFPYLLDRGITKIDYIVISHFDIDHYKGLEYIMKNLKVKNAIISKQPENSQNYQSFLKIVKEKKINVIVVNKGDKIEIEKDLYFYILWPDNNKFIMENTLNNNSLVFKLYYKSFSMLFTGDIEEIAEQKILKEYENNINIIKSTILKVAHHGSKTSSIQDFINRVKPKISLIGVGEKNKFGHPNDVVLERLKVLRN